MKPVGVMSSTYIDFGIKSNEKDSKFKVGNYLRISKHNIFAKGYVPNWSEEVLWLKKLKILCRGYILLVILMVKKLLKSFTKKNCKRQIKQNLG